MKSTTYYQLNIFGDAIPILVSGRRVYIQAESLVLKKKKYKVKFACAGQLRIDFEYKPADSQQVSISVEAISGLIKIHKDQLLRFAVSLTKNEHDAEDILGDAIVRIIEKRDKYHEQEKFTGWAARIIKNTFLNERAKIKNRNDRYGYTSELPDYYQEDESVFEPSITEKKGIDSALLDAINGIDLEYRNVILLISQGFKYDEIAVLEDIPIGTVRSRLHKGREIVKNKLVNI